LRKFLTLEYLDEARFATVQFEEFFIDIIFSLPEFLSNALKVHLKPPESTLLISKAGDRANVKGSTIEVLGLRFSLGISLQCHLYCF